MTEAQEVRTADMFYAAFLRTASVSFLRVDRDSKRIYFIFEKPESYDELRRSYFNRSGKVVAMDFADEIRAMKTLLYEETDKRG